MKRITRSRRLSPEEIAKYKEVRNQIDAELPDLVTRHHDRMASLDQLDDLLAQLKAAREAKGLSLADMMDLTGMDRSALSKLETGGRPNPTVETLVRYAEAVGKRLVVSLAKKSFSDEADNAFEQLLKCVISKSYECTKTSLVAKALLCFLMRESNSWLSIRTLQRNSPHEEVFAVDAGTLLRAMFDAYLQADYIAADKSKASERAEDYFDFEIVDRHKLQSRVLKYDNWFTRRLKSSPRAEGGIRTVNQEYDRVKGRFMVSKKIAKEGHSSRTRNHWYPGDLTNLARSLNKLDEYDLLLATFHGCVHSSSDAVRDGPPISSQHAIDWASTVAARVAQLNVEYNGIELNDLHRSLLVEWSKPYLVLRD